MYVEVSMDSVLHQKIKEMYNRMMEWAIDILVLKVGDEVTYSVVNSWKC